MDLARRGLEDLVQLLLTDLDEIYCNKVVKVLFIESLESIKPQSQSSTFEAIIQGLLR